MNYEDRVTKEYVENAVGDGLRLLTGTYTGDGAETRYIDLGVTPKLLGVWRNGYLQYADAYRYGGITFQGHPSDAVELSGTGFIVRRINSYFSNEKYSVFFYFALY